MDRTLRLPATTILPSDNSNYDNSSYDNSSSDDSGFDSSSDDNDI